MIRFGRYELDPAARELRADGATVHLEPQAFDLLVHLVTHRDRVVPREELLDAVWGHRYVSDAALTTRVKEIRRALDDDGRRQAVVRNVRGRGYRFVAAVDRDAGDVLGDEPSTAAAVTVEVASVLTAPVRLVGRERDLAALLQRVRPGSLVTITGPGGVGKTTLATEVLARLDPPPTDGVIRLELGELTDASAVVPALAGRLGVTLDGSADGSERLVAALPARDLALLVDNAEHVVEEVARLLGRLPLAGGRLRVLVTSRERLGVPAEQVWPLAPLDRAAALTLFTNRAEAAAPHLVASPSPDGSAHLEGADPDAAERIVAALDGLPLAIEMAAARLSSVDLDELERVVTRDLPGLRSADRAAATRHQGIQELVAWSIGLLADEERRVLEDIAVFAGVADLDAIEAVVGGDTTSLAGEGSTVPSVRRTVADLADRSLLAVDRTTRPAGYHLLHTVRSVVAPALTSRHRTVVLRKRHAAYHLGRAVELDAALRTPAEPQAHRAFAGLVPELRVAWSWLSAHDPDRLADLAAHVHLYAYSRFWSEPAGWAMDARRTGAVRPATSAVLDAIAAAASAHRGDAVDAIRLAEGALGASGAADQIALEVLADAGLYTGDLELVRSAADRLAALGRLRGDPHLRVLADVNRSLAATYAGDADHGHAVIEGTGVVDDDLAPSDRAWRAYCRGEAIATQVPGGGRAATVEAVAAFDRAIDEAASVDHHFAVSVARASRATTIARSGDAPAALAALADCLASCLAHGNLVHAATMVRNLTEVLVALDDPRTAVVLHSAFSSPRIAGSYGEEARRTGEVLAAVERRVGSTVTAAWREEGRALPLDRAIERAVEAAGRHGVLS